MTSDLMNSYLKIFSENRTTILILLVIILVVGLAAIVSNMVILGFYLPKYKNLYPALYTINSVCDFAAGIGGLLVGAILIQFYISPKSLKIGEGLVGLEFYVVSVSLRVSVFSSLVISTVRTINIVKPHFVVSYKATLVAVLAVFCFWVVIVGVELKFTLMKNSKGYCVLGSGMNATSLNVTYHNMLEQSKIAELFLQPFVGKEVLCEVHRLLETLPNPTLNTILIEGIPFVIPLCLSIISLLITSYSLPRTKAGRKSTKSRGITVTVFWLTFVFVLCYLPYFIVLLVLGHPIPETSSSVTVMVRFVTTSVLPFLSTCLIPTILIIRGKKIRRFYWALFVDRGQKRVKQARENNI